MFQPCSPHGHNAVRVVATNTGVWEGGGGPGTGPGNKAGSDCGGHGYHMAPCKPRLTHSHSQGLSVDNPCLSKPRKKHQNQTLIKFGFDGEPFKLCFCACVRRHVSLWGTVAIVGGFVWSYRTDCSCLWSIITEGCMPGSPTQDATY